MWQPHRCPVALTLWPRAPVWHRTAQGLMPSILKIFDIFFTVEYFFSFVLIVFNALC